MAIITNSLHTTATTTIVLLMLSILRTTTAKNGFPQASTYIDSTTGITFLGYADGTGFQFGMALPQDPSTDLIAQVVSPLTNKAGWGGVVFGDSMVGHLMVVAWPDGTGGVMASPRIATGYEVDDGANAYAANPVALRPIGEGTFVNATHVSATFVCGGCLNGDSFGASNSSATFSYAYSKTAVADPGDAKSQLSDHTANGEPYGPFGVTISEAESAEYATWAEMTGSGSDNSTSSGTGTATATSSSSPAATSQGSSSSSTTGSSGSTQAGDGDVVESTSLGSGVIVVLTLLGFVYLLQAVNIM